VAGMEILEMVGLKMTTSASTVFITNLGMLIIPYVGFLFFKRKVKTVDSIAVAIAILGMYMLVGGVHGFSIGDAVLLLSALSSAFYFIYSERFEAERARHITTLCVQQFFVISVICLVWGLYSGTSFTIESSLHFTLLWQIVLFTTIPYAIIQWASRYADEMIAAIYDGVVEPLVGGVMAWVIFMEPTSHVKVLGAVIMLLAFSIGFMSSKRWKRFLKYKMF
jgi:drug/metabolite transporter (DMT)-like permease